MKKDECILEVVILCISSGWCIYETSGAKFETRSASIYFFFYFIFFLSLCFFAETLLIEFLQSPNKHLFSLATPTTRLEGKRLENKITLDPSCYKFAPRGCRSSPGATFHNQHRKAFVNTVM